MNMQEFVVNFANQFDETELEVFNAEHVSVIWKSGVA